MVLETYRIAYCAVGLQSADLLYVVQSSLGKNKLFSSSYIFINCFKIYIFCPQYSLDSPKIIWNTLLLSFAFLTILFLCSIKKQIMKTQSFKIVRFKVYEQGSDSQVFKTGRKEMFIVPAGLFQSHGPELWREDQPVRDGRFRSSQRAGAADLIRPVLKYK